MAELNELGFHYSLVEGASVSPLPARAPRKASRSSSKAPSERSALPNLSFPKRPLITMAGCTDPKKAKKPFSLEELMEKGLAKVG